jgi:hypothetical protein
VKSGTALIRLVQAAQMRLRSVRTGGVVVIAIALLVSLCLNVVLWRGRALFENRKVILHSTGTGRVSAPASSPEDKGQSGSRFESKADFAKYAKALREQSLIGVEPQAFVPTASPRMTARFPWKTNIVTTVFWIGEKTGKHRSLTKSAWDENWARNYGGFDSPDPSARRDYIPVAFVPRLNPFYCALPYNDVAHGQFKPEAPLVIPWFKQSYTEPGRSVCQHRWIRIRKGNRGCYAQWEDCGPFRVDHFQYVFQNERPRPNANHGAGLNVSPAVRDYLGLQPTDLTDWQFVDVRDVSPGPWRSYGENNNFVIAKRELEQKGHEGEKRP